MPLCKGVNWWTQANLRNAMFIRARAADSRSLVMVAAKYFVSLCRVLSHRSCSVDVICNILEIYRKLKFGKNSWPSPQLHYQKGLFSTLSHLCLQCKSCHMKIRADGSLIGIYVSLLGPDTEQLLCNEKALHHGNLGGI